MSPGGLVWDIRKERLQDDRDHFPRDGSGLFHWQGLFWAGVAQSESPQRKKEALAGAERVCLFLGYINLVPTCRECRGWKVTKSQSTASASVPFNIFTATVRQVGDFLMPNADAWTTFPKAPLPSDLPTIEEGLGLFAKPTARVWVLSRKEMPCCTCYVGCTSLKGFRQGLTPTEAKWVHFSSLPLPLSPPPYPCPILQD